MTSMLNRLPPWLRWIFVRRWGNLFGFLVCASLLGYGYYLQFAKGLQPCPLCILQRLCLFATGVAFLVAGLHHPVRRWAAHLYGGLIALVAVKNDLALVAAALGAAALVAVAPVPASAAPGPGDLIVSAVDAGAEAAKRVGELICSHIIARPHADLLRNVGL